MEVVFGLLLVTLAGLGTGTLAWPFKVIKDIKFGHYLFFYILIGIVIMPWAIVIWNIPDLSLLFSQLDKKTLLISNLLSLGWGVANVLYLVCVLRIGAALTGAILSAFGMSVGVVMPMVLKGSGLFNNAPNLFSIPGMLILFGLLITLFGVLFVSKAGFLRERVLFDKDHSNSASGDFLTGLILAVIGGILSSGLSLSFVYGQDQIIESVQSQNVNFITANVTVWALCIIGGAIINLSYALFLIIKNMQGLFQWRKSEIIVGILAGIQFFLSIIALGNGMLYLGVLGASIGFGIQQSLQVFGNQLVGFIGGEWTGVKGKPRRQMYVGLILILIAVIFYAYSNYI